MKAAAEYYHVVLFIRPHEVVLTVDSADEILMCHTIHMKAAEQYFLVVLYVLFLMFQKIFLCQIPP